MQPESNVYTDGQYLESNPTWHVQDSPWKADQVIRLVERNDISPQSVCDVGCGAGEVLVQLQKRMDDNVQFQGYDVSPQAIEMCLPRANNRLGFTLGDFTGESDASFDLVIALDVIEHLEDYFTFLRGIKSKGTYTMFHIPLDLSVLTMIGPGHISKARQTVGHIHFFTKSIAIDALRQTGYEIVDYIYTPWATDSPHGLINHVLKPFRLLGFALHKDFAVRVLGGYSLLVLAR